MFIYGTHLQNRFLRYKFIGLKDRNSFTLTVALTYVNLYTKFLTTLRNPRLIGPIVNNPSKINKFWIRKSDPL